MKGEERVKGGSDGKEREGKEREEEEEQTLREAIDHQYRKLIHPFIHSIPFFRFFRFNS